MLQNVGILFSFGALISWGVGDFFIQKTTRAIGEWKSLFFIGLVGFIGLFPFVKNDLVFLSARNILFLSFVGLITFFASVLYFKALRKGKMAIVEPIMGIELPLTVILSIVVAKESLSFWQIVLIGFVFVGIICAITEHRAYLHYHKRIFERGIMLAAIGAMSMAFTNFLIGISSQNISPFVTLWFGYLLMVIFCGAHICFQRKFMHLFSDVRNFSKLIIGQSLFGNVAWICFALATTYIPISIATTISESYIALSVLLGLFINHERLKTHQMIGVVFVIINIIALSFFSS